MPIAALNFIVIWTSQLQYEKLRHFALVFRDLQNKFLHRMLAWLTRVKKLMSFYFWLKDSEEKTLGFGFAIRENLSPNHPSQPPWLTPPATACQNACYWFSITALELCCPGDLSVLTAIESPLYSSAHSSFKAVLLHVDFSCISKEISFTTYLKAVRKIQWQLIWFLSAI